MPDRFKSASVLAIALCLAGCGGGQVEAAASSAVTVVTGQGQGAATAPLPTPTPAPTPAPTPNAANDGARKILADQVFFARDSYFAYASPWCAVVNPTLVIGRDLVNTISVVPSTFPNDVVIATKAPAGDPNSYGCGVYGYHHIGFGNYDGSTLPTPVTSRQVKDITALSMKIEITDQQSDGQYNVLNEFYLTSSAGNAAAKVVEIGFFLHASPASIAFARTGTSLGVFTDASGRRWTVTKAAKFVMLMPADGGNVTSATIDGKGVMAFLVAKEVITGAEWFNGAALGVEPVRGSSTVAIGQWAVTYG